MTRSAGILALLFLLAGDAVGEDHPRKLKLEINNDIIFESDNFFSSGVSVQVFGEAEDTWKEARGTPAFGKKIAQFFLPRKATDRKFREGWATGSVISTPQNLMEEDLIEDDIPYSGLLAVTNSWVAFNDDRFAGFQYMFGIVGPAARGEFLQKVIHRFFPNSDDPKGWDNQLDNEPILNLTSMWKWKQWNEVSTEGSLNVDVVVGNWATLGDASLEMRFGRKRPRGFLYVPDMLGRSMTFDATLPREGVGQSVLYYSLVVRATGIARLLITDGSTFKDSPNVKDDRESFVGSLVGGIHYNRGLWEFSLDVTFTTDFFSDSEILGDEWNRFGTLTIGRRF